MQRLKPFVSGLLVPAITATFSFLLSPSSFSQTINNNNSGYGPKNKQGGRYATIYVIRTDDIPDNKRWYAVIYEKEALGQLYNNSKCEIRFPLDGKKRFWSAYNSSSAKSEVWLDLEYGRTYYLKMKITKGTKNEGPELSVLDSITGKSEFDNITKSTNYLYYPVPLNLPESMLGGSPFSSTTLEPYYYNVTDTFVCWKYLFKGPPYLHYFYFSQKFMHYYFTYHNTLLSSTYSEFIRVQASRVEEIKSEGELLDQLKKSLGNTDKQAKNKKEKLVSINYEPFKAFADFGWVITSEIEDYKTTQKGENDFLLTREIRAGLYKDTKEKTKVLVFIWLSERGTPDELYTLDEMKERLIQFTNGWELKDYEKQQLSGSGGQ